MRDPLDNIVGNDDFKLLDCLEKPSVKVEHFGKSRGLSLKDDLRILLEPSSP